MRSAHPNMRCSKRWIRTAGSERECIRTDAVRLSLDMRPSRAGALVAVGIGVGAALGTAFHSLALILAIVVQRR
jgi:hypothetical protein